MRNILFFGATDASDFLLYLSKLLQSSGKNLLLVDATFENYIKYSVPLLQNDTMITQYDSFDIAYGLTHQDQLDKFKSAGYDFIIVHCSSDNFLNPNKMDLFDDKFIIVSEDRVSQNKTMLLLSGLFQKFDSKTRLQFDKVLINQVTTDEMYWDTLLQGFPLTFAEQEFSIPYDESNYIAKIQNQDNNALSIKKLTKDYQTVLINIVSQIGKNDPKEVRSLIKKMSGRSLMAWGI